jgi:DNA-binding transcriptional regulator YdaS (Cro superfamily)
MSPDQLRDLMQRAGIATQRDLAQVVGVHYPCVNRWLRGNRAINHAYAALIREKLKSRLARRVTVA